MSGRVRGTLRSMWGLTTAVTECVVRHGQTARASQFAYNSFLASIPFLFVLVSVLGLVASPAAYRSLIDRLRGTIPGELADFLDSLLRSASSSTSQAGIFLVLGLVFGLYLAGNVAGCITDGLDDALERSHRRWIRGKAVAIGLAGITALVFVLTTVLAVFGPPVLQWTLDNVGASGVSRMVAQYSVAALGALIFYSYLVLLYRYAPNESSLHWRHVLPGALVGMVGWFIVANMFRLYVDNLGSYNRVYGSLGVVVVFLVFLFLTGLTILVGGEVTAELRRRDSAATG